MTGTRVAQRPGLLRGVAIPAAITLALLAALEGGCRLALRVSRGAWPETRAVSYTRLVEKIASAYQRHWALGVAPRPGARIEIAGHTLTFDARGYRGAGVEMPKPAGRRRVVCEGGSTTIDLLAPDDASTWPARLGELLRTRGADVVNAGFAGWTSLESLLSLEIRDLALSPDVVVVFHGVNDLQPAGHEPFTPDYSRGHGDILPRVLGVERVPVRLPARSVFLEWTLDRVAPRRAATEGYAPAWAWSGGARKGDIPDAAVEVFARNVRSIVGVARAHGAGTLLVAQAIRYRKEHDAEDRRYVESWTPGLTSDGAAAGLARYNEAARRVAAETGAVFLDPFAAGDFSDADFVDAFHFSPSGSRRFAERVADELARSALVPAARGAGH